MTEVWSSLAQRRSMAGYVVMGHDLDKSRPSWGLLFRVLTNPIAPQRLDQSRKSCLCGGSVGGCDTESGGCDARENNCLRAELLVKNLWIPFFLRGLCRSHCINVIPLTTKRKWWVKAVSSTARELVSRKIVAVKRLGPTLRGPAFASLTQVLVLEWAAPRV